MSPSSRGYNSIRTVRSFRALQLRTRIVQLLFQRSSLVSQSRDFVVFRFLRVRETLD